jgi:hypothetical protein
MTQIKSPVWTRAGGSVLHTAIGASVPTLRSPHRLPCPGVRRYPAAMFTIEHDFDATVITLVDEGAPHLQEDVTVQAFEDCVTVEQYDARLDAVMKITLSMAQLRDLGAALNLPEGIYRLTPKT